MGYKCAKKIMKKILIMLVAIVSIVVVGASAANIYLEPVPLGCKTVSGARVTGSYSTDGEYYCVSFDNNSGNRCSASGEVWGKVDGRWEKIDEFLLTADNKKAANYNVSLVKAGATQARLENISTWICE